MEMDGTQTEKTLPPQVNNANLPALLAMLDPTQLLAVQLAVDLSKRVIGIDGQAGTGKTTIFEVIYKSLRKAGYRVAACAPTGRAAKRIEEKTGIPATTAHKLLEYPSPGERDALTGQPLMPGDPKRCRNYPLEYDVVLCDEYAMVNHEMHRNLIGALPPGGCLRGFGDLNQLRPIEGNKALQRKDSPFREVLTRFDKVTLETTHRQSTGSDVLLNAERIMAGRAPRNLPDSRLHITNKPLDILRKIITPEFGTPTCQIITPTKKTWVGTWKLNALLQTHFIPGVSRKEMINLPRRKWEEENVTYVGAGDKIIWTENDYTLDIMNGETGMVTDTDIEYGVLTIDFGTRKIEVPPQVLREHSDGSVYQYDPRTSIDLAYAITTHKAQGSEYKTIIYLLNKSSRFIQCRSNLYTGMTRASESNDLITDVMSLTNSVTRITTQMEDK